jgi:hypothetical protein
LCEQPAQDSTAWKAGGAMIILEFVIRIRDAEMEWRRMIYCKAGLIGDFEWTTNVNRLL